MKIILSFILLLGCRLVFAQEIQKVEYFIDTDPGIGNAINIPIATGSSVTTNFNVPLLTGLPSGFHRFFIRAKDNSKWSMVFQQSFFKTNDLPNIQNISKLEYFIDSDPGFGQAVDIPVTTNSSITQSFNIPLPINLPSGFHKFLIRARDDSGKWSTVFHQNFFKSNDLPTIQNITKLEYFIDSDPGFGQAINIPIASNTTLTQGLNIPLPSNLPTGFHKFFIRARDASGKWSTVFQQNFFKTDDLPSLPNIVKLEYFVNVDPGFGQATDFPISASTLLNLDEPIFQIAPSLSSGNNTFYLRAKDATGKWSTIAQKTFTNCAVGATISSSPGNASCGTAIILNISLQNNNSSTLNWTWFKNGVEIANTANLNSIQATETAQFFAKLTTTGNGACNATNSNVLPVFIRTADSVKIKTNGISTNCNNTATLEVDAQNSFITSGLGITYTWFRNNVALSNSDSPSLNVNQGGSYKVRVNYNGGLASCGFIESNIIQILDKVPLISISPVSSLPDKIVVCTGSSIQLNALTDLTGTLTYQWFKDNVSLSGQTNATLLVNNAAGNYKVSVSGGGCTNLTSSNYILSYAGSATGSPTMNLTSGTLNSCPGSLATLSVSGCSGTVEWNNGFEGNTLSVTQLNAPFTYRAICRTNCMQQVVSPQIFTPTSSTLSEPKITVDDFPLSNNYNIIPSNVHGTAFRYNNFSPAIAVAPMEGGRNFFISPRFEFNAINKTHDLQFGLGNIGTGVPINNVIGQDIFLLQNNHFLMAGSSNAGIVGDKSVVSFGGNDFWILSRNVLGTKLWDKAFGGSGEEALSKVIQLPNGDLILAGTSSSAISGNKTAAHHGGSDFWVVKTDSLGNKLADFSYGGTGNDGLSHALLLSNGNILLVGGSDSGVSGNKTSAAIGAGDIWAVVMNANGTKIWDKTFGTTAFESGIWSVEKDGHIFISTANGSLNQVNDGIYKINLNGDLVQSVSFTFNDVFTAINSHFLINKIHKGPSGELVVVGKVSGQAAIGTIQFAYDYLLMFEIQDNLSIITSTKNTFGSGLADELGATFFDKEGNFNVIKSDGIFNCPESGDPNYVLYFIGNYAQYIANCNRQNITDGHWFKWTIKKYNFENRSYSDFCKGKEFLLKASIPNQPDLRNVTFNWSDGQTGQIIKITPQTRLPLYVSYKQNGVSNVCGSTVASVNLYPYGDKLVLAGNNFTDTNAKFAYKEISSSESLGVSANYRAEGGIVLSPGFQISGVSNKVFKAEIGGCVN